MKYGIDFWRPALNPANEFSALQKSINKLFNETFPTMTAGEWKALDFQPACDVEETTSEYRMCFDLPGMKKDDIKIEIVDNQVTVKGVRNEEKKDENKNRKVYERRYGSFERTFILPTAINANKVEAAYNNGVLSLVVPKDEAQKPRQIEVKECHIERNPQKKEIHPHAAPSQPKQAV